MSARHLVRDAGPPRPSPIRTAILAWVAASLLLLLNTAWRFAAVDGDTLPGQRRYWEDLTVAASRYAKALPGVEAVDIGSDQARRHALQSYLERAVESQAIRPWEFWRTVPVKPALRAGILEGRSSDDTGRAMLLAAGFRLLSGVAPVLPLWVGAFVFLPTLLWLCLEMAAADRPVAAASFAVGCASMPYVCESLALPYSAVGFYLTALLALAALATYVSLGQPRPLGILWRAGLGGLVFALCVLCRSSAFLMAPAYALTVAWGAARAAPLTGRCATTVRALGTVALLLTPYLLVRPTQQHEVWLGMWEGLGDFDRTHGHSWSDRVTKAVLRAEGGELLPGGPVWARAKENEALFRRLFMESVGADPAWYGAILAKRLLATVTLWKLWPWGPVDGSSFRVATTVNEGAMDTYYRMTTTAEWLGLGPSRVELPIVIVIAPTLALAFLWRPRGTPCVPRRAAGVLLAMAAGALVLPVAVTTASGIETEAFVLVYAMGGALLLEETWERWRARRREPRTAAPQP